jgi:hypothetical protein
LFRVRDIDCGYYEEREEDEIDAKSNKVFFSAMAKSLDARI